MNTSITIPSHCVPILGWARSAVAAKGGAFHALQPHEIAAPVLRSLLERTGTDAAWVDAVILGNALGAGGNPARMTALAAGLPQDCAALTVDTQCCSGLDAVTLAAAMIASGQADIVIAGGVEAWSRAPIRMTRPLHPDETPQEFERPAFAPDPAQDPDLLAAAGAHASALGITRAELDAYALMSHERALQTRESEQQPRNAAEIVSIAGIAGDTYPRRIAPERAARMPVVACAGGDNPGPGGPGMSALTISAKADGAALVMLASREACERHGLSARAHWIAGTGVGSTPSMPLAAAEKAARKALELAGRHLLLAEPLAADDMQAVELHDAFAVQGISFCRSLGLAQQQINAGGGGLARGHPIGASGAIALVRLLTELAQTRPPRRQAALGLAAIAGAGGIGAACVVACQQAQEFS